MLIHDKCMQAGVVGAGGAGFPTHVKLNCKADIVLANCSECEPLLRVDQQVALRFTEEVVNGLRFAMEACGAKEGKLCIIGKHKEAIAALERACVPGIEVFILKDYFPVGDEQQLVCDVTGRIVPVGGLPLDVGVVVQNFSTLRNIARAQRDIPVTHKHLTVTGEVATTMTIEAPLGMSFRDCIRLAGGPENEDNYGLIIGGPMMGFIEKKWDNVVTKTTSGIIVLPKNHLHLMRKDVPQSFNHKMAQIVCAECMTCTQLCPRNELGLNVKPHLAMRAAAYGKKYEDNGLFSCSNCGVCSYFACPFDLSPAAIMNEAKTAMLGSGRKPEKVQPQEVMPSREYSKVPVKRLIARLGLEKYDVAAPFYEKPIYTNQVRIPLKMHIGAPCQPVVSIGDVVNIGA
jgi:Na+-translocating ferredoxin:NAD+ oxidoreductase RnfC subunit